MKTISFRIALGMASVLATLLPAAFAQTNYVKPYAGTFNPNGDRSPNDLPPLIFLGGGPWPNITSAVKRSAGGVVEILGDTPVYGAVRLDSPAKIIRDSAMGPIKIGATPVSQTTFRCVSYNARLSGGGHTPGGWADHARASYIRDYDWGLPDVIGFCEIWNSDPMYTTYLAAMPGYVDDFTGFELWGSPQHSGLCLRSRYPLTNKFREEFTSGSGADFFASKSFLRARMVKDGIGIWVYMTHTQADDGATWGEIYGVRESQVDQIVADINLLRTFTLGGPPPFAGDVFFVMGDLNVFGEGGPPGSPNLSEYRMLIEKFAGVVGVRGGGMDLMKQIYPWNSEHTFSHENPLLQYFYPGTTLAESARLDYIFAISSRDGKVVVEPTDYEVIKAKAANPITEGGATHSDLSDHYAIAGDFRILRISN